MTVAINLYVCDYRLMSFSKNTNDFHSLKGHLLLAMPHMNDPRFHRAVIFMCVHDEKGAMGMVINNPLPSPDFTDVLSQVGINPDAPLDASVRNVPVLSGGPVQGVHGFLLHSADFQQKDTIQVDDLFSISGTIDSLRSIVGGYRPEKMLFTLGYAGWGPGQIEQELQENMWLSTQAGHEIVFDTRPEDKWEKAFSVLGISPAMISTIAGRA